MDSSVSKGRVLVSTIVGAALGYLFLHPYTVLVYGLYGRGSPDLDVLDFGSMMREALSAFDMHHLHMGLPFALLGAAAGLFFGAWMDMRRQKERSELRACAVDTMKTLMVTLSHYLLNAAAIIGGFAWRIQKEDADEETVKHAVVIRKEAQQIEAIVKSLESLREIVSESYAKDSEARIIDLTAEIKLRMEEQAGRGMPGAAPPPGEKEPT